MTRGGGEGWGSLRHSTKSERGLALDWAALKKDEFGSSGDLEIEDLAGG